MSEKTKNDLAWEKLFEKYQILKSVVSYGYFEISSSQINEYRESRLMAKFDHWVNLPKIFRDNHLSILPISRYKYIVGRFRTHFEIPSLDHDITFVRSPESFESISHLNLYSESAALNFAYLSGIIDDFIGEKSYQTISGRMSTGDFGFRINQLLEGSDKHYIDVNNSQCEIDAGFESDSYLSLIEAKNHGVNDFLVRQLYYPFRLWSSKISKKVLPILMTFSNDTFSFYSFGFRDVNEYSSIFLERHKRYEIESEPISLDDVSEILSAVNLLNEPDGVPFPQANRFERVVDLFGLLLDKDLLRNDITENYQFDVRQTQYYTDAGRYLGLIERYRNSDTGEVAFCLTEYGRKVVSMNHKRKYLSLIERMLSYRVFYDVFNKSLEIGSIPQVSQIANIMASNNLGLNSTTLMRRAGTVQRWMFWIWDQIED